MEWNFLVDGFTNELVFLPDVLTNEITQAVTPAFPGQYFVDALVLRW